MIVVKICRDQTLNPFGRMCNDPDMHVHYPEDLQADVATIPCNDKRFLVWVATLCIVSFFSETNPSVLCDGKVAWLSIHLWFMS